MRISLSMREGVNDVTGSICRSVVLGLAVMSFSLGANAQTANPNMPDTRTTVPEKIDPPQTSVSGNPNQPLSDKLERSEGVIAPRGNIDPGLTKTAPAPDSGAMPVIRPPGEPGGDQSVQPK